MTATQKNAPLCIETSAGQDAFQLLELSWRESLGAPFEGNLELASDRDNIDLAKLLMTTVLIRIDGKDGEPSYLHGHISRIENLGPELRLTRYRATIVPSISLLKQSGGCRIFQDFTTLDIIKKIFSNFGFSGQIESRLSGTYAKREYCVQYCESDFNFLSRIMQEEGIYYFFEYTKQKHCMVLADDVQAHRSAAGSQSIEYRPSHDTKLDEYLTHLNAAREFVTGAVELSDYDFQKPRAKLNVKQMSAGSDAKWSVFHYPGRFTESARGQAIAKIRQQSNDASGAWITMEGTARGVRCGNIFILKSHSSADRNIEYLITGATIQAELGGLEPGDDRPFSYHMSLEVQPSKLPFRPALTAAPAVISGPHIATVSGKSGEEIWTDNYGRIKVQFPWDLTGKSDENSSCWIRVAQAWTGKSWGAMSIPRIGEEVIVEFLNGDPDQPIVVGRVFNADMMPPEGLAAAQAKTIFRTHSTKGGDKNSFHELSFDDTKDSETIYLHSERDFKRVVENNDETLVGFEKKSPGNQALSVYNDSTIAIGQGSGEGSLQIEIEKDRSVSVAKGNDLLKVKNGDLTIQVDAGATLIKSAKSITLSCGESSIKLTPSKIEIVSPAIDIKATGNLKMQGGDSTLEGSGNLQLKGGIGKLMSSGPLTVQGAIVKIN